MAITHPLLIPGIGHMNEDVLNGLVAGAIINGAIQKPEELRSFLEAFIAMPPRHEEPKVIVEIGCDAGGMLWLWRKLGYKVLGVTLVNGPYSSPEPFESHGADTIIGDSHNPAVYTKVKQWLDGRKADLIFIDGDHTYQGVALDFDMYSPWAQAVAFHDIVPHEGHPDVGVWKLWQEIGAGQEFVKFGSKDGGIGLIKRGPDGWC